MIKKKLYNSSIIVRDIGKNMWGVCVSEPNFVSGDFYYSLKNFISEFDSVAAHPGVQPLISRPFSPPLVCS